MAFGYFESEIKLTHKIDAAWDKAIAIFDLLGWRCGTDNQNLIVAKTPISAFGWGETVLVSFEKKGRILVSSESRWPFQFFDGGKNRNNVEKFIEIFKRARMPLEKSEYASEKVRSFLDRFLSGR